MATRTNTARTVLACISLALVILSWATRNHVQVSPARDSTVPAAPAAGSKLDYEEWQRLIAAGSPAAGFTIESPPKRNGPA